MPVYEFYCPDCHAIFNFLSRRVVTDRTPCCPRCGRGDLSRKVSRFALSKNRPEREGDDGMPDIDEARLEKAMMGLASEMDGLDENDPRQLARFMKKFAESTGMNLDGSMGEAIRRLEEGADPESLEEELGDLFDDDSLASLFVKEGAGGIRKRLSPPEHDETLYPFDPA